MMRRLSLVLVVAGLSAMLAACSAGGAPTQSAPASSPASVAGPSASSTPAAQATTDLGTLRSSLRGAGLRVGSWSRGTGSAALFARGPRRPWRLPVEDVAILAYPFATIAAAERTVGGIDRKDPFPLIEFQGAPHVFRSGRVILLFVESGGRSPSPGDARILVALRSQFGTDCAPRS